jgi:addiction module HigA family antidote
MGDMQTGMMGRFAPMPPVHPGEVLLTEFLRPMRLKPDAFAWAIKLPVAYLERLVREDAAITAAVALKFSKFFGTSAVFWLKLQAAYDSGRQQAEAAKPRPLEVAKA